MLKLGFGMMRLPCTNSQLDIPQICSMVDYYIGQGFRWFDTAYFYHDGKSESVISETIVKRHRREDFCVATKLPLYCITEGKDALRIFNEQCARTNLEYFDRYLLHAMDQKGFETSEKFGLWDFLRQQKAAGNVKKIGFSFHDSAEVLEKILTAYPDVDFVQLQINYVDWDNAKIQSRLNYETACRHNLDIIVMEPVKGGLLAGQLPKAARNLLNEISSNYSPAEWALRFAGSLQHVVTVLSGMSDIGQIKTNTKLFSNFQYLSEQETKALHDAAKIMEQVKTIPCTGCSYCKEKCPIALSIPNLIKAWNNTLKFGLSSGAEQAFYRASSSGKPSDCIKCGACETICPQHLPIRDTLKKLSESFEGGKKK